LTTLKQLIPQEFCLKCKGCCRFANVRSLWSPCFLLKEIEIFKKNGIPLCLRPKAKKAKLVYSKGCYFCPFFNLDKNYCTVYHLRPFDCRLYPFLLRSRREKVYLAVDKNCPYIEKIFGKQEFKTYLAGLIKFLKQPKIKRLIQQNRQLIGIFPEKTVVNLIHLPLQP